MGQRRHRKVDHPPPPLPPPPTEDRTVCMKLQLAWDSPSVRIKSFLLEIEDGTEFFSVVTDQARRNSGVSLEWIHLAELYHHCIIVSL